MNGCIVPWRAGDPESSFLILLCFMSSKKYTLVAWTENGKVRMVPCGYANIKVTTPEDMAIAEALIRMNARQEND